MAATTTIARLNTCYAAAASELLRGIYEHSPWVATEALAQRPFKSLAHLKLALADAVTAAGADRQLALLCAHPELAGKAMLAGTLTAESTDEQGRSGLTHCSAAELRRLHALNDAYNAHFGWPFILAVRGPRGSGLTRAEIIATFERRSGDHPDAELAECLRNVHRIAELRLNDLFGAEPAEGNLVWDWAERLAVHTDEAEAGTLTVTYLTDAHRACARQLADWMRGDCGFDTVTIDAVGNVVGIYRGIDADAPRLLTGSHYDTVRNGGKYDGRLGIFVPMACVRALHRTGARLPFGIEVVGFAEEEGVRYRTAFLGSSALTGSFDPTWLDRADAAGITLRDALRRIGSDAAAIDSLARRAADYLGFVEVHIEQGPVLAEGDRPLGIVTSINGSRRYTGSVTGLASHAGTTPMTRRRDAAAAVAEIVLAVERRAGAAPDLVGTVGQLQVPGGTLNVVPGRCDFSIDLRAPADSALTDLDADVRAAIDEICARRGVRCALQPVLRATAAPSDAAWQARWERAVEALGLPVMRLPSGAGHDAMQLHSLLPQAMLFVRGGNLGISHNPLETVTNDDAQSAVDAFAQLLQQLAEAAA